MRLIYILLFIYPSFLFSQSIGINEDGSSPIHNAILDIKSNSKGIVIPRMTTSERNQISLPYTEGLLIFNTTTKQFEYWTIENSLLLWKSVTMDDDNDPQNELQTISKNNDSVTLSDGGGTISVNDNDADPTNEWQTLSLQAGRILQLNPGGGTVTFPQNLDNDWTNELQTISINGEVITLSHNGSNITLPTDDVNDADSDPSNEFQMLSYTGGQLTISDGNTVSITGPDNLGNHNATQEVVMNDERISLLAPPIFAGDATNKTYVDAHEDGDADDTNEFQNLSKNGDQISISNGNTITIPGDNLGNATALSHLNMNTYKINNLGPPVSGGDAATKLYVDNNIGTDPDPTNEIQDLNFAFDTLYITNNPGAYKIGFNKYLDNTDNQAITSMTLLNNILTIQMENAGAAQVNLSSLANDDQGFDVAQLLGTDLRLHIEDSGDPTEVIDQSSIANTDNQTLSESGTDLIISGGNSVDIKQNFIGDLNNSTKVETQALSDRITFTTNSTKIAEFNSLGNLAINNNAPNANSKLDVQATASFGIGITTNASGGDGIGLVADGSLYAAQFNGRLDINDDVEVNGKLSMEDNIDDVNLDMIVPGISSGKVLMRQLGTKHVYLGDIDDNGANLVLRSAGLDRLVVENSGNIVVLDGNITTLNNLNTLGVDNNRWNRLFAINNTSTTSDRRLKKNINNISYGLEAIRQLRPVVYEWKNGENGEKLGFIAQELSEVIPEVVHVPENSDEFLSVSYSDLIPVLVKSIQEQQELIANQKNDFLSLMSRLEKLESLVETQSLTHSKSTKD